MLPGTGKKCWRGQEITEPGKCIFYGTKSGKASQSKRHTWAEFWGILGRKTDKDNSSGAQNHRALWKKNKYFESAALKAHLFQEPWGRAGAGGWGQAPICLEKGGSEIIVKRFRQASGSPQDPCVGPNRPGTQEAVTGTTQSAASTKGGFQVILGIPCFPKPDSPGSKVAGGWGGAD